MWTVVYMSPNKDMALKVQSALEDAEILTKLKVVKDEDEKVSGYEILVVHSDIENALSIIVEM